MLVRSITFVDRLVLRWLVRRLPKRLGDAVTWLGQAASGGGLWIVSAAVLAALGTRGRRAARSGLVAYGVTSGIANGPAKLLFRRPRPGGAALAGLRRRGRPPGTSSFPSSHSAAAMAFAVAASTELPGAAPVLLPAALGVCLSRMRAVRHYPSDVAAGVLLGAGVGTATVYVFRYWERRQEGAGTPGGRP